MNDIYRLKYLKYKAKYLNARAVQDGGKWMSATPSILSQPSQVSTSAANVDELLKNSLMRLKESNITLDPENAVHIPIIKSLRKQIEQIIREKGSFTYDDYRQLFNKNVELRTEFMINGTI